MLDSDRKTMLAKLLMWELGMLRTLRDTAIRERRFDDANDYAKQLQAAERRAQKFVDSNTTGDDR